MLFQRVFADVGSPPPTSHASKLNSSAESSSSNLPASPQSSNATNPSTQQNSPFIQSLTAAFLGGAVAGFSEHSVMYPVDTIKTRLQVSGQPGMPTYTSVVQAGRQIIKEEGIRRLYRGLPAVLVAAIPSHAAYFTSLEAARILLQTTNTTQQNQPIVNAVAGACGTIAHDMIVTPLDVVKQRLQVAGSQFTGTWHCLTEIMRNGNGMRTLFASYPTTLAMNVPFMAIFVSTYESVKFHLERKDILHSTPQHLTAAAIAGAISGTITTPLDVIKTRIQTGGVQSGISSAFFEAASSIQQESGMKGFFRGSTARALYFMPSAAIVWSTYEVVKEVFGIELQDDDMLPI